MSYTLREAVSTQKDPGSAVHTVIVYSTKYSEFALKRTVASQIPPVPSWNRLKSEDVDCCSGVLYIFVENSLCWSGHHIDFPSEIY